MLSVAAGVVVISNAGVSLHQQRVSNILPWAFGPLGSLATEYNSTVLNKSMQSKISHRLPEAVADQGLHILQQLEVLTLVNSYVKKYTCIFVLYFV